MSSGLDRNDLKRFRVSRYVPNQAKVYTYHWFALTNLAPAARVCGKKKKRACGQTSPLVKKNRERHNVIMYIAKQHFVTDGIILQL